MSCPSMTPDFPLWALGFAAQHRRLRATAGATLHQFEALFGPMDRAFPVGSAGGG